MQMIHAFVVSCFDDDSIYHDQANLENFDVENVKQWLTTRYEYGHIVEYIQYSAEQCYDVIRVYSVNGICHIFSYKAR
jgi:hypothetical protein